MLIAQVLLRPSVGLFGVLGSDLPKLRHLVIRNASGNEGMYPASQACHGVQPEPWWATWLPTVPRYSETLQTARNVLLGQLRNFAFMTRDLVVESQCPMLRRADVQF